MDTKKAGQLLDRINALHKSLTIIEGDEISDIERDLMLSYLRRLYDIYLADQQTVVSPPPKKSRRTKSTVAPPAKPVVVEETPPPPTPAPVESPAPVEPVVVTPVSPVIPQPPKTAAVPAKIAKLFKQPEAKELSERLSRQPVKDLTRALTINDRVQFANVLFAGNSDLMNSVLQRLNTYPNMDKAKTDLVELAEQFKWAEGDNADVAQNFIKLVSRRYV